MINGLYSLYDTIAEEFSAPFMVKNHALARRIYENQVKQGAIKEELQCWFLCNFDTENGVLDYNVTRERVDNKEYLKEIENG